MVLGEQRFEAVDVHHHIALLVAAHDAVNERALQVGELEIDFLALGLLDFLNDDLLSQLGADAAEGLVFYENFMDIAHLELGPGEFRRRHHFPHLGLGFLQNVIVIDDEPLAVGAVFAVVGIDGDPNGHLIVEALPGGRRQRAFQRLEDRFPRNFFFVGHRLGDGKDFFGHSYS